MPETTELWALHIEGPDDIYAMPSKEAAENHARILNDYFNDPRREGYFFLRQAFAVHWPYSAEAHAEDMRENLKAFS